MRISRTLLVVMAGALLTLGAPDRPVQAAPDEKAGQVAKAYENARQLYRQGKYEAAIKAFDEVKDLKYHPILDYGIANCYEGLRDHTKAVYYLKKYIRNHSKHSMSPKHPSVADVEEKIKVLEQRAASGGGGTPPVAGGTPTSGTPASGGGDDPAGMPGDPVPGPDPYAVPPPPGGGATGPVYGGGGAPPPVGVHHVAAGPARRSLMVSVDFGAASFAGGSSYGWAANTGGGIFATALWRFIPWLAVGLHGGVSAMDAEYCDAGGCYAGDALYFALGMLEARGILPLGRFDFWASFGIGYAAVGQPINEYETMSTAGPAIAVGLGIDWFLARTFSLGLVTRIYKMIPSEICNAPGESGCRAIQSDEDMGVSWYAGLSVTWHYPLFFGRPR